MELSSLFIFILFLEKVLESFIHIEDKSFDIVLVEFLVEWNDVDFLGRRHIHQVNLSWLEILVPQHEQMQVLIYLFTSHIALWVNHSLRQILNRLLKLPLHLGIFLVCSDVNQHEMSFEEKFFHILLVPITISQFGMSFKLKKFVQMKFRIKLREVH